MIFGCDTPLQAMGVSTIASLLSLEDKLLPITHHQYVYNSLKTGT